MSTAAAITIRRQILAVEVRGTEADGLALQRRLPGICADLLAPAIESALAPYDPGDAHLSISRLEIDVSVALDQLEVELAEAVRRELADWFRARAPARPGSAPAGPHGEVRQRSPAQTVDDALVSFLGTGRLPWSFDVPAGTSLEDMVMESWVVAGRPPAPPSRTLERLRAVLETPQARTRLALQFSAAFRTVVLRVIAPGTAAAAEEVGSVLARAGTREAAPTALDALLREVAEVAWAAAVAGGPAGPAELVAQAWARLSTKAPSPGAPSVRALAELVQRHWPDAEALLQGPQTPPPGPVADAAPLGLPTATAPAPSPGLTQERPLGAVGPTRPATSARSVPIDDLDDGILVDSAGLVLLHPFLARFLEGLGLARGEQLLDPQRAVGLLHHLATGERTAPEHRLTLAKVLCGLPLDEPVPRDVGVGTRGDADSYAAEAIALLDAVIGHWTALRDSSPDALRGEFLTRPGLLSLTDDGDWLLRVESRTVDILLADLPWGFSMFRLPWMSALMQVEWR